MPDNVIIYSVAIFNKTEYFQINRVMNLRVLL